MKPFGRSGGVFSFIWALILPTIVVSQISSSTLEKFPDVLQLSATKGFDPIIAAYWTGLPHHRRTPFAVSPDGKSAYLAYLDASLNTVYVQKVDPASFKAVGEAVEIAGAKEAGGLVARNDGFALLATVKATGTSNLPPKEYSVATIIRYKDGAMAWTTPINGPGVHEADGLSASPDMNGDLVYSEASGLYAAYIVVTAYTGSASGHFGDSIQYVDDSGKLQKITGATSSWGCSHNTGIALEAADKPPFASVCAEDHGAIWLNTATQSMNGVKIANENTTNGVSGEPMGGMGGSYSSLALFPKTEQYIFAWQSRGAVNLKPDSWMGSGFTTCDPRWLNHNVAIAVTKTKSTLVGSQAISQVGAASGDSQINWITKSDTIDHQNVRVAAFNSDNALVTWEELSNPDCKPVPLSCSGTYSGTFFQQVDRDGKKVGDAFSVKDAFVAGDIQLVGQKLCWPYVNMNWDLSAPKSTGGSISKISFACLSLGNGGTSSQIGSVKSRNTPEAGNSSTTGISSTFSGTGYLSPTSIAPNATHTPGGGPTGTTRSFKKNTSTRRTRKPSRGTAIAPWPAPSPAPTGAPTGTTEEGFGQLQVCKETKDCTSKGMKCFDLGNGFGLCMPPMKGVKFAQLGN